MAGNKENVERAGIALVQKMFELEQAYRALDEKDEELGSLKSLEEKMERSRADDKQKLTERDREVVRLEYENVRLKERLKEKSVEVAVAKKEVKAEKEKFAKLERTCKEAENEKRQLNSKLSSLRVKLGVANANYNVGKYETDQLRKSYQESQINNARLEERLNAATSELDRLRDPATAERSSVIQNLVQAEKQEIRKLRNSLDKERDLRSITMESLAEKEEEIREMGFELSMLREKISSLQVQVDSFELKMKEEKDEKAELESKIEELQEEKEKFDDHIKTFKVKLGVSKAGRNANERLANELKKKDEEYKATLKEYEKKLKSAYMELDRIRLRAMPGKTGVSVEDHELRMKKRNGLNLPVSNYPKTSRTAPKSTRDAWAPKNKDKENVKDKDKDKDKSKEKEKEKEKVANSSSSKNKFPATPKTAKSS